MTQGELFDMPPQRVPEADMKGLVLDSMAPCRLCGLSSTLQKQRFHKGQVQLMQDMARLHREGNEWVRVNSGNMIMGVKTTRYLKTAYCCDHFAYRCSYWGFTEQEGVRIAHWKLTPLGYQFLQGETAAWRRCLTRKRKVFYASHETVLISQVKDVVLDKEYWDNFPWSDLA